MVTLILVLRIGYGLASAVVPMKDMDACLEAAARVYLDDRAVIRAYCVGRDGEFAQPERWTTW